MIRGLEHISCEVSERVGVVQPGKEKAVGTPHCVLSVL